MFEVGHRLGPTWCTPGVYFLVGTMGIANFLCTCIAINLMLTICFGIDPIQRRLEKWYIIGSIVLGYAIPITPAALGSFGWDEELRTCWIATNVISERVKHLLFGIYIWELLTCFISAICVIAVLTVLFRQGQATTRALMQGHDLNKLVVEQPTWFAPFRRRPTQTANNSPTDLELSTPSSTDDDELYHSHDSEHEHEQVEDKRPSFLSRYSVIKQIRKHRQENETKTISKNSLSDKFLSIAIRVSFYPIMLIAVNLIMTIGDLYVSNRGGVGTNYVFGVYCFYDFLYGGRGMFYALLAIAVDPCLVRGLKAAWKARRLARKSSPSDQEENIEDLDFVPSLVDINSNDAEEGAHEYGLEKENIYRSGCPHSNSQSQSDSKRERMDSATSMDLFGALAQIPGEHPGDQLEVTIGRTKCSCNKERGPRLTKTFPGVPDGVLPEGLTGEVDVDADQLAFSLSISERRDTATSAGLAQPSFRRPTLEEIDAGGADQNSLRLERQRTRQEKRREARKRFQELQGRL
ncbi:hypothetical protein CI109_104352 [Kwoniella shandongensis]|uniref:Uncharacterized protein n=1 Tax=Kwoniella shandongensis TaxID=1734106 RepID=A0A5M6BX23_9TREE|nr:uncharacterized protein CI109_004252 [Kwoniella shandongensis]KAA5527436.1 hypothetical protein CI109_004252 [Kwoniella shandongensis]